MSNDNVVKLIQPGILTDRLSEVLRDGARALLTQAVEAEVSEFLSATADLKTDGVCRRIVRHGHLPERQIMTGIGPVAVRQPRVRDREAGADDPARIRFTPAILPPYARRSKSLDTLIPILYLKGVSTGDFAPALAALLGKDAPGLSATTIARLKEVWTDEHKRWSERDLSAKSYVYVWADSVYLQARLEAEAQCILVIIGVTPEGKKELLGFVDGARESAHDWRALLLDLKRRGLSMAPKVAVADGALGFWKAIGELWPKTREQRCWVHKTANILNKLPKSQQPKAKRMLQDIWMAETRKDAEAAFDVFVETWDQVREGRRMSEEGPGLAARLLRLPGRTLETPAHINPIESTFATVRHRTTRSKGCLSNRTALAMVFKLVEGAQKTWRRLDGHNQLPKIIRGVKFIDGCEVIAKPGDLQSQTAAA